MKLNERKKKFCDLYIELGNATKSYQGAYCETMNDYTAAASASRLLRNSKVIEYITELNKHFEDDTIASTIEIKQRLTNYIERQGREPSRPN